MFLVSDRSCLVIRSTVSDHINGLRPKIGLGLSLGLAGLVLCCETRPCHARRHNDLKGQSNYSVIVYLFWSWNITTVINNGIHLLKS